MCVRNTNKYIISEGPLCLVCDSHGVSAILWRFLIYKESTNSIYTDRKNYLFTWCFGIVFAPTMLLILGIKLFSLNRSLQQANRQPYAHICKCVLFNEIQIIFSNLDVLDPASFCCFCCLKVATQGSKAVLSYSEMFSKIESLGFP